MRFGLNDMWAGATFNFDGFYITFPSNTGFGYYVRENNIVAGQWYHLALTRDSSNNIRFFIDGVNRELYNHQMADSNPDGLIGTSFVENGTFNFDGAKFSQGHAQFPTGIDGGIDEVRIIKDSAEWCEDFTKPTTPHDCVTPTNCTPPPDGNTAVFHLDNNTDAACNASTITATAVGIVEYSTGQFTNALDFGEASTTLTFDAPGVTLPSGSGEGEGEGGTACADNPLCFDGEFTIDFWIKLSTEERFFSILGIDIKGTEILQANPGDGGDVNTVLEFTYGDFGSAFSAATDQIIIVRTAGMSGGHLYELPSDPTGTWVHIALTRDSNNAVRFFWNGIALIALDMENSLAVVGTSYTNTNTLDINGAGGLTTDYGNPFLGLPFNGEIDEFRIVKGSAEWCEDFDINTINQSAHDCVTPTNCTPPPPPVNTSLFHFDNDLDEECDSGVVSTDSKNINFSQINNRNALDFNGTDSYIDINVEEEE